MSNLSQFCTCTDLECPCHPTNHDKGCSPCIAKNLQQGEIPSCFFKKVNPDEKHDAYFFEDFAKSVMKNKCDNDGLLRTIKMVDVAARI